MDKTPPKADEQLQQRPGKARAPRSQPEASYYSDEHPEIPRVKRASLYINTLKASPISAAYPGRPRRFSATEQVKEHAKSNIHPQVPPKDTSAKIMVARQRRRGVYEPPSPTTHHPGRHRRRSSLLPHLYVLGRNKLLRNVGIAILILLSASLIINGILHGDFSRASTSVSIFGGSVTNNASTNGASSDPHALVITPSDLDHPAPPVMATSAYLLDEDTGATLYAHNPFEHLPMLSTTKLMTALLAAEQGNPDQNITINDSITRDINQLSADSSIMGLKKGETYTLRDLLYGLMLVSGNDAAIAIADSISGNLNGFVAKMNQRAKQLGLNDTHYMNPHGLLADNHYSSAHDLAVLGRISLNNSLIHQVSGTKEYHITQSANHADHDLINGNQFLWWYPGVDAGKPGWDGDTNFIQVVSVARNHHHLIGVTMHTSDWWTDMRDLMNWGFDNFNWTSPYDVDLQHPIPFDTDWNYFVKDKRENTIPGPDQGRYYIYTGYSISGIIMAYFDKNNGLKKFGFPISEPKASSDTSISQAFEHGTIQCDTNARACTTP